MKMVFFNAEVVKNYVGLLSQRDSNVWKANQICTIYFINKIKKIFYIVGLMYLASLENENTEKSI